jgi:hypothetical protein
MDDEKSENYKWVKRYFDKVILFRPARAVPESVLIEVMVNDIAVALQQDNSYKKQNYAKHHTCAHSCFP